MLRRSSVGLLAVAALLMGTVQASADETSGVTQLAAPLSSSGVEQSIFVQSVEGFSADGGAAVVDRGTSSEEFVNYGSVDSSTNSLAEVMRPAPTQHEVGASVESQAAAVSEMPQLPCPEPNAEPEVPCIPLPVDGPPVATDPDDPERIVGPAPAPKVDPVTVPAPGGGTTVDAAEHTEGFIGGGGLPVGVDTENGVPVIEGPSNGDGPSGAAVAGSDSCYYYGTSFAKGGIRDGTIGPDANYGVDTTLGAHGYARAYNQSYDTTRNTVEVWASAGVRVKYTSNRGNSGSASVVLPWRVLGRIDTGISCDPARATCSQASSDTTVDLVLKDLSTGSVLSEAQVASFSQQGDSVSTRQDNGNREFFFTAQPGHSYAAFIRVEVLSTTDIPYPGLGARATNDFMFGPDNLRRAWLKWVRFKLFGENLNVKCS